MAAVIKRREQVDLGVRPPHCVHDVKAPRLGPKVPLIKTIHNNDFWIHSNEHVEPCLGWKVDWRAQSQFMQIKTVQLCWDAKWHECMISCLPYSYMAISSCSVFMAACSLFLHETQHTADVMNAPVFMQLVISESWHLSVNVDVFHKLDRVCEPHLPRDQVLQFLYLLEVLWVFLHVLIIEEGLERREKK